MKFLQILLPMQIKKKSKTKSVLLYISIFLLFLFVVLLALTTYFFNKYTLDKTKLTSINNGVAISSTFKDENGLYNTSRTIVNLESLPKYVPDAFVSIEDKRFYSHNGYDIKRIFKAGFINLKSKNKSQGASTISQQLIKNALLSNKKTYSRKVEEIVLAIKMEKEFSKQKILEMYLNTIYFGSNAYGIENASHIYFDKSAKDLTLNEACCLAGIIKSPYNYSPKHNYENAMQRKNLVAKQMRDQGFISQKEFEEVVSCPISVENDINFDYSYESEVIQQASSLLNLNEREIINNDYKIISYKDDNLQNKVAEYTKDVLNEFPNSDSLTIVLNNDGKVVSFYSNSSYNLHNVRCQVASTLKPLAVYLPCIQHNILTPVSQIVDEPIDYSGFSPKNADNTFHGVVSSRYSIAKSLNIPAVKLLDCLGIEKSNQALRSLGINISKEDKNLSLALGATKNGVKLLDLLSAYSTIANMGVFHAPTFIEKILDKNGKTIYIDQDYSETVLKSEDCFLLTDMLKDSSTYGTAKRFKELNIPVASKTGTASLSQKNTDILNVCYTTKHTILTWISNIKDKYLNENMLSSVQPTEINKKILAYLYSKEKPADFVVPSNIKYLPYNTIELKNNKKIVAPYIGLQERFVQYDYFKSDNVPVEHIENNDDKLKVEIDKYGANICFNVNENDSYRLFKVSSSGTDTIEISVSGNVFHYQDKNIFEHDEITYYYTRNNIKSNSITIRPKDFLITLLNNEIANGKKKWSV